MMQEHMEQLKLASKSYRLVEGGPRSQHAGYVGMEEDSATAKYLLAGALPLDAKSSFLSERDDRLAALDSDPAVLDQTQRAAKTQRPWETNPRSFEAA